MATVTEADMSPDASPGQKSVATGVRRVNNIPLFLIGAVLAIFVVIMGFVAFDRAAQQTRPAPPEEQRERGSSVMLARAIAGEMSDGIVAAAPTSAQKQSAAAATPASTTPEIIVARPLDPDLPPPPPASEQPLNAPRIPSRSAEPDDHADQVRRSKLAQFDEAVRARTAVAIPSIRPSGLALPQTFATNGSPARRDGTAAELAAVRRELDAAMRDEPAATFRRRADGLRYDAMDGARPPAEAGSPSAGTRNDIERFSGSGDSDRWALKSQPEAPVTPFSLRAGFVIPALLVSGINSELPGQIIGQVSQDVRDTARGQWVLIPQGSRLLGQYSSDVVYGQARVLIAWQRIVFPDGKALDIGTMPGADGAGYAGLRDSVNNHYWRTFSSALLMSAVTAGIASSQPRSSGYDRPNFGGALSESVGQQLGQVTSQLIAKNFNVAPTLEIRPGFRFNVVVTKDLNFPRPYRAFDYQPGR